MNSQSAFRRDKAIKFLRTARFHALEFSKDNSTQVGCILVNPKTGAILSSGYNGMPAGCDDSKVERLARPEKYFWFEHAERNAIYTAADEGVALHGCVAVVTMVPCMDCARALARIRCAEVIACVPDATLTDRWGEHFSRTFELFEELGIRMTVIPVSEVEDASIVPSRNLNSGWTMQMNPSLLRNDESVS